MDLGLRILPSLKEIGWLLIEGEELDKLEQEANTIKENISLIVEATGYREDYIMWRLQNLIDCIAKANEVNGGVSIG